MRDQIARFAGLKLQNTKTKEKSNTLAQLKCLRDMPMDVETLFRKYGPMVNRRCMQLLKDEEEAADVTQEVFVRLLEKENALSDEYPSSLLWTIATRLCLNKIRDRKHHEQGESGDQLLVQIACLEDHFARFEAGSFLDRIFGRHPESTRTIAVLHFLDGMTLEEVAKEVSLSVSGVRKRIRILQETLKSEEGI